MPRSSALYQGGLGLYLLGRPSFLWPSLVGMTTARWQFPVGHSSEASINGNMSLSITVVTPRCRSVGPSRGVCAFQDYAYAEVRGILLFVRNSEESECCHW